MSVVLKIVVKGEGKERGHLSNTVSCYIVFVFHVFPRYLKIAGGKLLYLIQSFYGVFFNTDFEIDKGKKWRKLYKNSV